MQIIACENCGKHYDFLKDDFCPKCGAFNQPVKTWTTDSQGNFRRVDGVNEVNHAGSFVHKEVHKEKQVRKAAGLDWNGKAKPPVKPAPKQASKPAAQRKQKERKSMVFTFLIVFGLIVFFNFLLPLLLALFGM